MKKLMIIYVHQNELFHLKKYIWNVFRPNFCLEAFLSIFDILENNALKCFQKVLRIFEH